MMNFIQIEKKADAQKTVQNQFVKFLITVVIYCDVDSTTGNSCYEIVQLY